MLRFIYRDGRFTNTWTPYKERKDQKDREEDASQASGLQPRDAQGRSLSLSELKEAQKGHNSY